MNGAVNDFLLDLYRASTRLSSAALHPWLFGALHQVVSFDAALWCRRTALAADERPQRWYIARQPEGPIEECHIVELWRADDGVQLGSSQSRASSVCTSRTDCPSPRMRSFLGRHRLEHALTTTSAADGTPGPTDVVTLFRLEREPRFDDAEATAMETLMPHLRDVLRESRLRDLARACRSSSAFERFGVAVVGADFKVCEAQAEFGELMAREWPWWHGPTLPEELEASLDTSPDHPWSGHAITVYCRPQHDRTLLLCARRTHPLDSLAPRKRQVALLFSRGASQTEIARALHLSPSTVNNYLGHVYQLLQLRDKTDLSRLVVRLEP